MKISLKYLLLFILGIVVLAILGSFGLWFFKEPSNNRIWEFGQEKNQYVKIEKDNIEVKDLRDFDWTKKGHETNFRDFSFNLSDIDGLEVGVSHFSTHEGIGHVFLIFTMHNGKDIALSIESRREVGESFSLQGGLLFDYELIYILTTKNDLLSLREKRKERVYVYPIKIDAQKAQKLFLLIAEKVNSLYETPEFYHLFFKNCTNLIVKEVEKISDRKFPFYEETFAPGYTGETLFKMGLIDTELKDFKKIREKFLVDFK